LGCIAQGGQGKEGSHVDGAKTANSTKKLCSWKYSLKVQKMSNGKFKDYFA
jgi:hypothetical protein